MKLNTTLYFLLGVSIFLAFVQEDDLLKKIVTQLEQYQQTYPEEKAYLHTDKPYYIAGDKLWFKAYLVEGMTNQPDTVSVPLYVDLIDLSAQKLIDRHIIKLEKGFGYGDFTLPDSLSAGIYRLRAYTNWMLNFDENLFFTKDFQIYSSSQQSEIEKLNAQEIDFQCFPEGGSLIDGLESRVAFKAVDASGKGIDIVGELVSSEGDTLLNFKSEHLGMGFFKFKPEAGKTYQAVVKYQNIFHQSFNLPPTQKEGFSMIIDNISSKTAIKVILASNLPNTEMQIIGQSKGVAFYAGKVPAGKQSAFISIPKDKFPPGVAQFTIFDENLRPRCERVIFIQPTTELSFSIKPDKSIYRTREKTTLEIEVKDNLGNPVEGNFSMSVLDEKQIKEGGNAETILTNLLLSSDLKGNIEQPTYYFDKTQRSANYHLDILLMTQGWRRFTWEKILQPKLAPPRFLLERGLTIDGQVLRQNDKPFDKQVNLTLVLGRDSTQQYLVSEAEKNGSFLLYGLSFADSCEVTIQATIDDENANAKIALTAQTLPKIPLVSKKLGVVEVEYRNLVDYLKYTKDALELQRKLKLDDAIMLNEVSVKARKKVEARPVPKVLYSRAEATVKGDASPSALNVFDLLRGKVAGVYIGGDRTNPTIAMRAATSINVDGNPLFLIDGAPATKFTVLSLDINLVDRVEIVKSLAGAVMYGDQARGGIVSVFTKNANLTASRQATEGIEVSKLLGYYTTKEFYVPKYDQDLPQHIRPDYRSTVYWKPNIKTDKNGKAIVSYFNTDAETKHRIHIEGLSFDGLMGSEEGTYDVKK